MKKILLKKHTLILVGGYPGAGKTYLAKKIARRISCVYMDKDSLQDIFSTKRLDKTAAKARPIVYKIMYKITEENLANHTSVLLDAPFSLTRYMQNKDWVTFIKNIANNHKASIKVIWCVVPDKTRQQRIRKRAAGRDKERFSYLGKFIDMDKYIEPTKKFPIPFKYIIFHTEKDRLTKAIKFLET